MAKRLNKKVALIGTLILAIIGIVGVFVVLRFTQDPAKFLADGDAAWEAGELTKAERNYLRARAKAKNNESRLKAVNKLIDFYLETEQWPPLRGMWQEVLNINPKDYAIRYVRLKYFYVVCETGMRGLWKDVETQATEFLEMLSDDQLKEDTAQWESPYYEKVQLVHEPLAGSDGVQRIGQYLYLLRGRARLMIASSGAATEPDLLLDDAVNDLQKAQELEPTNIAISENLAQAYIAKGDILATRGAINERQKAQDNAVEILSKAVETTPDNPQANINFLLAEQNMQLSRAEAQDNRELLATFEPRYAELVERFPDSDMLYYAQSQYYFRRLGAENIDKAIEAIEKARQIKPEEVRYSISAATYYDYKSAFEDDFSAQQKAIDILNEILDLPALQETQGPQHYRNINNRAITYSNLVWMYLDRILHESDTVTEEQKEQWMAASERAIHEIEQILGSGEDPAVIKWQGVLDLAKGNHSQGIKKLYALYQQQKAAKRTDTQLAYFLAKEFENSREIGAVIDFYGTALKLGEDSRDNPNESIINRRPNVLLDYAFVLLRAKAALTASRVVNSYEYTFGANDRSRNILIAALIDAGDYEKAQEILDEVQEDNFEIMQLKTRLLLQKKSLAGGKIANEQLKGMETDIDLGENIEQEQEPAQEPVDVEKLKKDVIAYNEEIVTLVKKLLQVEPDSISDATIIDICRGYERYENKQKAEALARHYLTYHPDNVIIKTYLEVLKQEGEITPEQRRQINENVILNLEDPLEKALRLGILYRELGENEKAKEQLKKVFDNYTAKIDSESVGNEEAMGRLSVSFLFETVINLQEWELAQKLIEIVQKQNMDQCNGDYFKARLAVIRGENKQALGLLDRCLQQRPVFSMGYLMRGQVKRELDRDDEAIDDFRQSVKLNPFDSATVRALAVALYQRNSKLGENVTTDQFIEAKQAIARAVSLAPSDMQLLSFYAYYVRDDEPKQALSIIQRIYSYSPTAQNALRLASLAFELAQKEIDEKKKQLLLDLAEKTFEEAFQMDPSSGTTITSYAQFCRSIGQQEKAENLIKNSQDKELTWKYYVNSGKYEEAKQLLEEMHQQRPKDPNIIKGLLIVAERTVNGEDFKKMSEVFLEVDDTKENRLIQVAGLINTGLINDADMKLQSFMEQYPDDSEAQLLASEISMKQGKLDEALELANKSLNTEENNAYAWLLRGQINTMKGNYSQAIADINKSRSINNDVKSRIALSRVYILSGRMGDAKTELSTIAYEPTTPDMARFLLEAVYYQTRDDTGLQQFYLRMIGIFPDSVLWLAKAADYSMNRRNYEDAQKLYNLVWKKSEQQQRPNVNALMGYLFSLVEGGKLQEAVKQAQKYVDSSYSYIALIAIAKAKNAEGNSQAAIDYFKKAADNIQDRPDIAVNVLNEMGRVVGMEEVKKYCRDTISVNPNSIVANYVMARLSLMDGDFNKTVDYLDKCVDIVGEDSPQAVQFLSEKANTIAKAYERTSDNNYFNEAINVWEGLLKRNPDDIFVLNNIAYMLANNEKDLEKALGFADTARLKSPNNPAILDTYAYVLYKNSRFEDAEQYCQSAVQLFEDRQAYAPIDVYEHLGMIKEKTEDPNGAIEAYKKALEIGGENIPQKQSERINDALTRIAEK
ncbi:MAG: hypothetical protein JW804_05175 [Sedimentisphaerales bacterium]|nr:hypothetical protein [Sedimentisphaerales bacterium]